MKRGVILAFSRRGMETAGRIARALEGEYETECLRPEGNLRPLVEARFPVSDALIFVGSCGIAVRAIAPFLKGKTRDPAVIVSDETGKWVISLLSGHIGGANALALRIARAIGAQPVITTATDVNKRFSVDAWATKAGLSIGSMDLAKRFSAAILERDLPLCSDFPVEGPPPAGVFWGDSGALGAAVSCLKKNPFEETLCLVPQKLHLGVGCRRGTPCSAFEEILSALPIHPEAVRSVASIDIKQDEQGLLDFCAAHNWGARFYPAAQLMALGGEFTGSDFVQKTVGVDNVCERAAMVSAGPGARLILRKTISGGVTMAAATEDWRVCFE